MLPEDLVNPYDHLMGPPADQQAYAIELRLKFEEALVKFVLERYDLLDTRTRFCLLDLARQHGHPGDGRWLTLASFNKFFPAYPVQLYAWRLSQAQRERLTFPAVWCDFFQTTFATEILKVLLYDPRGPSVVHSMDDFRKRFYQQPSAIIFKWQGAIPLKKSPTLHFKVPVNNTAAAAHYMYVTAYGLKLFLEPLWVVLQAVDNAIDPQRAWLRSALRKEHLEPVEKRQ